MTEGEEGGGVMQQNGYKRASVQKELFILGEIGSLESGIAEHFCIRYRVGLSILLAQHCMYISRFLGLHVLN